MDPLLILILLSLAVAAYMFAAIKYPALRWMFRLKSGAAWVGGVDLDQNEQIGHSVGKVMCPIIGVVALLFAGYLTMQWKQGNAPQNEHQARLAESKLRREARALAILKEGDISEITSGRLTPTADGEAKIKLFVKQLTESLDPKSDFQLLRSTGHVTGGWKIIFKREGLTRHRESLMLYPEQDKAFLMLRSDIYQITIPKEAQEAWKNIADLEKVDLFALQKEAQRLRREKEARERNYKFKTYKGMAAYEMYDAIHSVPEAERAAKKLKYIGQPVDWELRVYTYQSKKDLNLITVIAKQKRPTKGNNWNIYLELEPEKVPTLEDGNKAFFIRVTGRIKSVDNKIILDVTSINGFTP